MKEIQYHEQLYFAVENELKNLSSLALVDSKADTSQFLYYLKKAINKNNVVIAEEIWNLNPTQAEQEICDPSINFPTENFIKFFLENIGKTIFILPLLLNQSHFVGCFINKTERGLALRYFNPTGNKEASSGEDREALRRVQEGLKLATQQSESNINIFFEPIKVLSDQQQINGVDCAYVASQAFVDIASDLPISIPPFNSNNIDFYAKAIAKARANFCNPAIVGKDYADTILRDQILSRLGKALTEFLHGETIRDFIKQEHIAEGLLSQKYYNILHQLWLTVNQIEKEDGFKDIQGLFLTDQAINYLKSSVLNRIKLEDLKKFSTCFLEPYFPEHGDIIFVLNSSLGNKNNHSDKPAKKQSQNPSQATKSAVERKISQLTQRAMKNSHFCKESKQYQQSFNSPHKSQIAGDNMQFKYIVQESYRNLYSNIKDFEETTKEEESNLSNKKIKYLVTIPYKIYEENSIQEIIDIFANKAFNSQQQASKNLAMIIGINRKQGKYSDINIEEKIRNIRSNFYVKIFFFEWCGEESNPDFIPYGDINNFIKESEEAKDLIQLLRNHECKTIYYAKFDSDTKDLNYCFSHYEKKILDYQETFMEFPNIVTSGYVTHEKDKPFLNLGVEADYVARKSFSSYLPFSPYVTEANALIWLPDEDAYLKERYGQEREMVGMKQEICDKRKVDLYKLVCFVENGPIITEYRPREAEKINFYGTYKDGYYINWLSSDIKGLKEIWQSHYTNNPRFLLARIERDLSLLMTNILQLKYSSIDFKLLNRAFILVQRKIYNCFDPVSITIASLHPVQQEKDDKKFKTHSLAGNEDFISTLIQVLENYHEYTGWRKPNEIGPSPYKLERKTPGARTSLTYPAKKDPIISILNRSSTIAQLTENFKCLLAVYLFIFLYGQNEYKKKEHIFFDYSFHEIVWYKFLKKELSKKEYDKALREETELIRENPDGTVQYIKYSFRNYDAIVNSINGGNFQKLLDFTKNKIPDYVDNYIKGEHDKAVQIKKLLQERLLLSNNVHIPTFLELFAKGKSEKYDNSSDLSWQPCHESVFQENMDNFKSALKNDLNTVGPYNYTILHIVAIAKNLSYLQLAIEAVSKLPSKQRLEILNAKSDGGYTAIELAFMSNKKQQIMKLIEAGAEFGTLAYERTFEKQSLLHIAAQLGSAKSFFKVLEVVKAKKDEPNDPRDLLDYVNATPLHVFLEAERNNLKMLKALISLKNINFIDDDGYTPILNANEYLGMDKVIKYLVTKGADFISKVDELSSSPFEQAIEKGNLELTRLMLSKISSVKLLELIYQSPNILNKLNYYPITELLNNAICKIIKIILHNFNNKDIDKSKIEKFNSKVRFFVLFNLKYENLCKIIHDYSVISKKVQYGYFAGQLPSDIRAINSELEKIESGSCMIMAGVKNIISIANNMGKQHPILLAAIKCDNIFQSIRLIKSDKNIDKESIPNNFPNSVKTQITNVFPLKDIKKNSKFYSASIPHQLIQSNLPHTFFAKLHEEFIIEHRNENAIIRRAYDKRFGLVLINPGK